MTDIKVSIQLSSSFSFVTGRSNLDADLTDSPYHIKAEDFA